MEYQCVDIDTEIKDYIHYRTVNASQFLNSTIQDHYRRQREIALSQARSKANAAQLNSMIVKMNGEVQDAKAAYDIVKALGSGEKNLLESTLSSIAEKLNKSIEQQLSNTQYSDIITKVHSYSSSLKGDPENDIKPVMGTKAAEEFFNQVKKALSLIVSEEDLPTEDLDALQQIFGNGPNPSQEIKITTSKSIKAAYQVVKYLSNAAKALKKAGPEGLSAQSFGGTITNIFHTVIGETLAKELATEGLTEALKQSDDAIVKGLKALGGTKEVTVATSGTGRTSQDKKVVKVDLLTDKLFQLSAKYNNKKITIDMSSNFSVKWGKKGGKKIQLVSKTPLSSVIQTIGNTQATYNILAHRYSSNYLSGEGNVAEKSREGPFYQAYQNVRATIAGIFFTDWLIGSGESLTFENTQGVDTAQFLMYNGKIYAMTDIVKAVCDTYTGDVSSLAISADIQGIDDVKNTWKKAADSSKQAMWDAAASRSDATKAAINALTVGGTLKPALLKTIKT